jgi:hypothetical protein
MRAPWVLAAANKVPTLQPYMPHCVQMTTLPTSKHLLYIRQRLANPDTVGRYKTACLVPHAMSVLWHEKHNARLNQLRKLH